jgi:hypothetical protein
MIATREDYKSVIFSGCSIEYKGVSLCNLANHNPRMVRSNEYQVWSQRDNVFSLYKNIDDAVDKFLELKRGKN